MNVESLLCGALTRLLRSYGVRAAEVTSYEEDIESDGYCDTCYYEFTVVRIHYTSEAGESKTYTWSGTFSDLIREL